METQRTARSGSATSLRQIIGLHSASARGLVWGGGNVPSECKGQRGSDNPARSRLSPPPPLCSFFHCCCFFFLLLFLVRDFGGEQCSQRKVVSDVRATAAKACGRWNACRRVALEREERPQCFFSALFFSGIPNQQNFWPLDFQELFVELIIRCSGTKTQVGAQKHKLRLKITDK